MLRVLARATSSRFPPMRESRFHAIAFVENVSLRDWATLFPGGRRSTHEPLAALHLLDKPDETWEDPAVNRIYDELRAEFDLADRFHALELKLRSVQEALELVLDVARDRRLLLLEIAVVLLIGMELAAGFLH